ncbi:MAG: ATP-binding protein [Moraxellaceae bacterium]|nr:ATP-binding protein [Moraxellaceae bacterium]
MPSSIFIRIYGGLLLIITVVALSAYAFIEEVNAQRADSYREGMATGVFRLIALGVSRQEEGSARDNWLIEAGRLLDAPLTVVEAAGQGFDQDDLQLLAQGRAVVRLFEDQNYADIYTRVPGARELYIKTRMSKVGEQQAKAMAVFFLEELEQYPGREERRLQEMQRFFSYPVTLMPLDKAGLDRDQHARIRRNEVVLVLKEGSGRRNSSVKVVAPLPSGDRVLVMGPMYLFDWMPVQLVIMVGIAALAMITIAAYFIIHPLERQLKKMEMAVRRIRGGDLSARAQVQGSDEVSQLAHAFNGMAEHIQRLIDSQREMTRAVSHELRTPVARLRFGMEMLADTDDVEQRHDQLQLLDQDVEQLNQLIDEILTYAKLEQGTPSLKFETIALAGLLQRVSQETQALNTGHVIEVVQAGSEVRVEAEMRYLHRVLQNLAGNAVRYARSRVCLRGGIDGNWAWASVEDDGPGIPEKDRERIFEPFSRLDDSRTRASGGYGLGLSIVQRIAFWHGGSVMVDQSPELKGARFTFRWPVRQSTRHAKGRTGDNTL